MVYNKFNHENNAICLLNLSIEDDASVLIGQGNYNRFPTANFIIQVTESDAEGNVTARENILIATRSGSTFNVAVGGRAYEPVPIDDDATSSIQQALPFTGGVAVIENVMSTAVIEDEQNEITRLETDKFAKAGGALTGAILLAKWANKASASTVDLATATGNEIHITGTTTITAFGTVQAGAEFTLIFDGILTLTHNVTSLILPNAGSNILTAPGDVAVMVSEWSGNWKCKSYQPANGQPLQASAADSVKKTYTAGEALTAWNAVRMGVASIIEEQYHVENHVYSLDNVGIGYSNTYTYLGQSFTTKAGPSGKILTSITVYLQKVGTPSGNLSMKIYTGAGTWLLNSSSNTIAETSLSATWLTRCVFTFPSTALSNSTQYFWRLETDRGNSTSNYTMVAQQANIASNFSGGVGYRISNVPTWTSLTTQSFNFRVEVGLWEDTTRIYKTCSLYPELVEAVGFADASASAAASVVVNTDGSDDNQSGLTAWKYYLSDTPGAISQTQWTYKVEAGVYESATTISINFLKAYRPTYVHRIEKDLSEASATTKYFHWLGKIPEFIETYSLGVSASAQRTSEGYYTAKDGNSCIYSDGTSALHSSVFALWLYTNSTSWQQGVISAADEYSYTVTWTKVSTPAITNRIYIKLS